MKKGTNKKNKFKSFILLLCIIMIVISFLGYQKTKLDKAKQQEAKRLEVLKKIEYINNTYSLFIEGQKIDKKDGLATFFNNTIDVHNKTSNLSIDELNIKHLQNIDKTINGLKERKKEINKIIYEKIDEHLKEYTKEEIAAINKIYNNSIIIIEKEDNLKIKNNVLKQIDDRLSFLTFLKENKSDYYLNGNMIMGKKNEFVTKAKSYKTKFVIGNELDYGKKIPVLTYHAVDDTTWGDSGLFVKISDFEDQMKYLHDNGYTTLFISEITNALNYTNPVIITFDDGYMNIYTKAFPIMQKYNIKSTFYIITEWMDGYTFVSPEIVKIMDKSGLVEIGSHSLSHMKLGVNSFDSQEKEIKKSKEALEQILDKKINSFAYPYGSYNIDTINLSKEHYSNAVTVESGFNFSKTLSLYKLRRQKISRGESINSFIFKIGG